MQGQPTQPGPEFTGKRTLVTGGTKGIGAAIVARLAAGGATVLTTARSVPANAPAAAFVQADVNTSDGCNRVIKESLERFGGLDILINSVGGSAAPGGGALALNDEHWREAFELNLLSAVRLDRGFPAVDGEARFRSYHPRFLDPENTTLIRGHPRLRRRQGRSKQLQQGAFQGV